MLEQIPTGWSHDLWEAAKTAGPFGTMLLLVILIFVSRMYRNERKLNQTYAERLFTLAESTKGALDVTNKQIDNNTTAIEAFKNVVTTYLLNGSNGGTGKRRRG